MTDAQVNSLISAINTQSAANVAAQGVLLSWVAGVIVVLLAVLCISTAILVRRS